MDYSYILNASVPEKEKLLEYGFIQDDGIFVLKRNIEGGEFRTVVKLGTDSVTAEVFENSTDEKYVLFDVATAAGGFVGSLREQVNDLIKDIQARCFLCTDVKEIYCSWIKEHFSAEPDFPWSDMPEYGVYRCKGGKWFALIMKIKFRNLGINSDEPVWVVNLKADPDRIEKVVDRKSVFPAYHMSKKYWITVLLTAVTDMKLLEMLTEESFTLVQGKKSYLKQD